jgi:ubiquinone/menaquinone biosynthesis C-methylase UbiE
LREHHQNASLIGLDISPESLKYSSRSTRYSILADIEAVPFKKDSIDGFVVASVIQWVADFKRCLHDLRECLNKKGAVLFSVFTDKSFYELNTVKRTFGLSVPVTLPSEDSFLTILNQCEFSVSNYDTLEHTYFFPTAIDALKSMSGYGATAATDSALTKNKIKELCVEYERQFKCDKGVPVTYNAITGIAIKES